MVNRILFIDDERSVLDSLRRMFRALRDEWDMTFLTSSQAAWERLLDDDFDAAVMDVRMPEIGGFELLERMSKNPRTQWIPVVMMTGLCDPAMKRKALDLGAADIIGKPVELDQLRSRLRNLVQMKKYIDALRSDNERLQQKVREYDDHLERSRLGIIWRLAKAAENRDIETGNHVIRVGCYSRCIAEELEKGDDFVRDIFLAAPLHDIGKIGIPDSILLCRGPLSEEQWEIMKQHCAIGARILSEDPGVLRAYRHWRGLDSRRDFDDAGNSILDMAATIALTHHEKWDGSGYPQGLVCEEIPLESRIVTIADVFDAISSKRSYKTAHGEEEALLTIARIAPTHFDPDIYEAFVRALPEIRSIGDRFDDSGETQPTIEEAWDEPSLVC